LEVVYFIVIHINWYIDTDLEYCYNENLKYLTLLLLPGSNQKGWLVEVGKEVKTLQWGGWRKGQLYHVVTGWLTLLL
jgi:hypothetical protein